MTPIGKLEAFIRGRLVIFTAHIETSLGVIILLATQKKGIIQQQSNIMIKFKGMRFKTKLEEAQKIIDEFYPVKSEKIKLLIAEANELMVYRNQIAHCMISWEDDPTLKSFTVWDAIIAEDGTHVHYPFKYTIDEHIKKVEQVKGVAEKLIDLANEIALDLDSMVPGFWGLLRKEPPQQENTPTIY